MLNAYHPQSVASRVWMRFAGSPLPPKNGRLGEASLPSALNPGKASAPPRRSSRVPWPAAAFAASARDAQGALTGCSSGPGLRIPCASGVPPWYTAKPAGTRSRAEDRYATAEACQAATNPLVYAEMFV